MKKRMLALLLAAVLCFGLLPVTAAADGDNTSYVAKIGDTGYTSFADALAAANAANKSTGATIMLLKNNIDVSGTITGNVTIDQNLMVAGIDGQTPITSGLTVASTGTLTFNGNNGSKAFNVPITIQNGATVTINKIQTVAPVTFEGDGTNTSLTIEGSYFSSVSSNDPFSIPANATVCITATTASCTEFSKGIQIAGGRTLQDIVGSGNGGKNDKNKWADMTESNYTSGVSIVNGAPLSDLTVEVQKGSGNSNNLTYAPLAGTNNTYSTTVSAGEALKFTATATTTTTSGSEGASYSWKVDGNELGSGSTYDWVLTADDIGKSHTVVCTATADGFSLTKTLTVTINQKPVKVEAYSPTANKTDTTWYDDINTALSGITTAYSRATVSITENQTLSSALPSADLTFELNQKTLTGTINTGNKVTLKGGTVDGTLSCADLTLDNVTLSQKLTVSEGKTLTIQNAPITLSGGISYSGLKDYLENNSLILKRGTSYISYANTENDYSDSVTIESHTHDYTSGNCVCGAQKPVN